MQMVNDCIKEFKDVFSKAEFNALTERRPWDHVIKLPPVSNLWAVRSTLSMALSKRTWTCSSKRTYALVAFAPPRAPWPLPLLHQGEGRLTVPCPRLLQAQRDDSQEQISLAPHPRADRQAEAVPALHQGGRAMGIQHSLPIMQTSRQADKTTVTLSC